MTIATFSLSSPQSPSSPLQLGDKVYTTDGPGKVSTRRRRGSLLVGKVIECGGGGEVTVVMRQRVVAPP
jgi:hypothetical protein